MLDLRGDPAQCQSPDERAERPDDHPVSGEVSSTAGICGGHAGLGRHLSPARAVRIRPNGKRDLRVAGGGEGGERLPVRFQRGFGTDPPGAGERTERDLVQTLGERSPPCSRHVGQRERRWNRCGVTAQSDPDPARQGAEDEQCPDRRDGGQIGVRHRRFDRAEIGVQQASVAFPYIEFR